MMNRNFEDCLGPILVTLLILVITYTAFAHTVFALRHPWATETERFLFSKEALCFERVSKHQMRK